MSPYGRIVRGEILRSREDSNLRRVSLRSTTTTHLPPPPPEPPPTPHLPGVPKMSYNDDTAGLSASAKGRTSRPSGAPPRKAKRRNSGSEGNLPAPTPGGGSTHLGFDNDDDSPNLAAGGRRASVNLHSRSQSPYVVLSYCVTS